MSSPAVSIGVPVFNAGRYLEQALESLVGQDFEDLEIIVCDNASDDTTEQIARSFAGQDPRVRYERAERNRGAAHNFNRTLQLARGQYFKWAAYDDVCGAQLVSKCVQALQDDPSAVLSYPKTWEIDAKGQIVGEFYDGLHLADETPARRLALLLRSRTEYHPVFGVIRTEALRRAGGIRSFIASDIALLARLALAGKFLELDERLFYRRIHPETSMNSNPTLAARAAWFDPGARGWLAVPTARLAADFAASVATAGMTPAQRVRCWAAIGNSWVAPQARIIGGEVKLAARATLAHARRRTQRAEASSGSG